MSDLPAVVTKELTVSEQTYLALVPVLLDTTIEPADKQRQSLELLLLEAQRQIEAETDENSPWFVADVDDNETRARKAGVKDYMTATRALEVLNNLRMALNISEVELVNVIHRRRLDLFPADGEYKDLMGIVMDIHQGRAGGRQRGIVAFVQGVYQSFEDAGVSAHELHEIIQEHAGETNDGISILAPMAAAANKVLKDPTLKPAQRKRKIREIATRARTMSVRQLETFYADRRVPPMACSVIREGEGAVIVLRADRESQVDLFEGRMQDAIEQAGYDLLRPVTPGAVLRASAENDWAGLLVLSILADPVNNAVYGLIAKNGSRPTFFDDLASILDMREDRIRIALGELVRYRLVEEGTIAERSVWNIVM